MHNNIRGTLFVVLLLSLPPSLDFIFARLTLVIDFADFYVERFPEHIRINRNCSHCHRVHRVQPYELSLPLTNISQSAPRTHTFTRRIANIAMAWVIWLTPCVGAFFFLHFRDNFTFIFRKLYTSTWRRWNRKKRIVLNILFHLCSAHIHEFTNIRPTLSPSSSSPERIVALLSLSSFKTIAGFLWTGIVVRFIIVRRVLVRPWWIHLCQRTRYWINKTTEIWMREHLLNFFSLSPARRRLSYRKKSSGKKLSSSNCVELMFCLRGTIARMLKTQKLLLLLLL